MLITQFLSKARLRSSQFGLVVCGAPWGGRVPPLNRAGMFLLREGSCWLDVEGHAPVELFAGDVALMPRGAGHRLCSDLHVPSESAMEIVRKRPMQTYTLRHGGDGPRTVFCAALSTWDDVAQGTVARILPELIIVRRSEFGTDSEIDSIMAMMEREARKAREACPVIANELLNLALTEVLFAKFGDGDARNALVKSFARPQITRALMLVHSSLTPDWTVNDLAARVGLSRSAFTLEFSAVMGMAPGQYLTEQKLIRAAALLRSTPHDLATIADLVGYASVPSFIKAFKQRFRMSPGSYRRQPAVASQDWMAAAMKVAAP
jgi:AraC-like DNA-binding protein